MVDRRLSRRKFLSGVATAAALPALWSRDASAQTGPAPPTNVRLVSSGSSSSSARQLLGGWRIAQDWARGAIAIDFATNRLWMSGHAQRAEIVEYQLPPMGTGSDINAWPRVDPVRVIPGWWPAAQGYCYGLLFWQGKVWVAPRVFYAQGTDSSMPLTIYAQDGAARTFATLTRQKFSGFVKRGPGLDPLIGGGGLDSGQGTSSGPTLGTLAGQPLIEYPWPAMPGANLEYWNERAPREPNYRPLSGGVPMDSWVGWLPRTVNGQLEGRWASDRVFGGGLVLPEGITYWPWMGTGDLDYNLQSYTFAPDEMNRTYEYRYDANTYQLFGSAQRPEFGSSPVNGQELDSAGRIYLAVGSAWTSSVYQVDVALKVFG